MVRFENIIFNAHHFHYAELVPVEGARDRARIGLHLLRGTKLTYFFHDYSTDQAEVTFRNLRSDIASALKEGK